MLFLLIFSLAIVAITITELPIVIVLLRLSSFIFLISKHRKVFFVTTGACFLALISRQLYQRRYYGDLGSMTSNNSKTHSTSAITQSGHLSVGIIEDLVSSGKYIYTDNTNQYLLYSAKSYKPGNQIRLVARNSYSLTNRKSVFDITLDSIFYSGFNSQKRSKMKGYKNILYETNSILINTGSIRGFAKIRYLLRQKIEATYQKSQTAGLVLGMLIGDKSKFSKSEYQLFIDSGLVHLVAVSGGNIVMLVTFLMALLFFLPFYFRIVVILIVVLLYGVICGMDSSVLRAVLMGAVSLIALLVGRGSSLRRLLGLVYISMLVYDPYFLVYDVGFLLSFSAVLGIVFIDVFKLETKKNSIIEIDKKMGIKTKKTILIRLYNCYKLLSRFSLRIISNYLKPSLGATLGIFPVIIFFMGKINIGGVIGNLFVLPLVPVIMIGGFITAFLPSRLQKYCIYIIDTMVSRNYKVAMLINQYGPTIIAEAYGIKFLIFFSSIVMMTLVIWTLTKKEAIRTKHDEDANILDTQNSGPYDDIIGHINVEISKKP